MATVEATPVESGGVERSFAEALDERFIAAWNSHVPEQLLSLMTDDVIYEDSSWPTVMRGHEAVRAFLESTWRASPDLELRIEPEDGGVILDPVAPRTARCWHGAATQSGVWDPPGLAPTGRRFEFHGVVVFELRDQKIARAQVSYDVASIMRQLGVLPQRDSLGERLVVRAADLRARLRRR